VSARARDADDFPTPGGSDPARISRVRFLEEQIRELLADAKQGRETNQPGAAVAARREAAALRLELDKLRSYERERRKKRTPLERARSLGVQAESAGSYQAARDFLRIEVELQAEESARREHEKRDRLAHMNLDERIARLVEVLQGLPTEVREQVRAAVFAEVH
jgi:hypothetical protein